MPSFSRASAARLATCHPDLQTVCNELIKQYDFSVLEGHRARAAQEAAFKSGNSRLHWPYSAHNKLPSLAVDIVPYPVDWNNLERFRELVVRFDAVACVLRGAGQITQHFIYGADWKHFPDWPHIEIKEK